MSGSAKPPPKKGGWGSMLSSAVAGIESRLDTILADEPDAAAKQRPVAAGTTATAEPPHREARPRPAGTLTPAGSGAAASRDASRSRAADRLAERLARATAQKARVSGDGGSRAASPARAGSGRPSVEVKREVEGELPAVEVVEEKVEDASKADAKAAGGEAEGDAAAGSAASSTLLSSGLPINPARRSLESPRPSFEALASDDAASSRPSLDAPNGGTTRTAAELEAELERVHAEHDAAEALRQDEMHAHLERIDALQAKLQYLAKETVAAAKQANAAAATTPGSSAEEKLAAKDEQIALLMEEGEKLSKNELRQLQTIKKLRAKGADDERALLESRKKLDKAERSETEHRHRLRRAEASERQASERSRQTAALERQVDELRLELDGATDQILALTAQLREAEESAERAANDAQVKAAEVDKSKVADLQDELEDARLEKKLADDRAKAEVRKAREEGDRQRERWAATELGLMNEIKATEARLEAMRARAEEASSEVEGGESSVKLLRQIEMLQNQYNLAKGNWETIEGSLNARLVAMERERDEAGRREAEVRRKARDAVTKARRAEEDLEGGSQRIHDLTAELKKQHERTDALRQTSQLADAALADAKADFDRQRRLWESELAARLEEEKARWQRGARPYNTLRTDSAPISRKESLVDVLPRRAGGYSIKAASPEPFHGFDRSLTRRSSAMPPPPRDLTSSPALSRHDTGPLAFADPNGMPPTPSIETDADADADFGRTPSPDRTINDVVSTAASGAGPSVQLVERMSAAVRRLEGEKAAHRDELARLSAQRDEARDQTVALMREVDGVRAARQHSVDLAKDMKAVQQRYEACLEMLGEREEEVDDLRGDVDDLKRIYRELVEQKVGK